MTTPATESLPRRNSDPVWLQDYFVHTGHDANTRSGTATFVKRKGLHYVCTCRHIMESIRDPKVFPDAKFPTLALTIDEEIINLARMTANGPELVMGTPGPETEHAKTDIAIAPLDAIDLDRWREPNWSTVRFGLACGYPDEHKKNVSANSSDQVANQLITVVAELASTPGDASRTITLNSALADPHSWFFSGDLTSLTYARACARVSGPGFYQVAITLPVGATGESILQGIVVGIFRPVGKHTHSSTREHVRGGTLSLWARTSMPTDYLAHRAGA
jgi:hypothetical protein